MSFDEYNFSAFSIKALRRAFEHHAALGRFSYVVSRGQNVHVLFVEPNILEPFYRMTILDALTFG